MILSLVLFTLLTVHCDTNLVLNHETSFTMILLGTEGVLYHNLDFTPVLKLDATNVLAVDRDLNPRREIDSICRVNTTAG